MDVKEVKKYQCKLCGEYFNYEDMSEEHYPAKSVGNEDIVKFDIFKSIDLLMSKEFHKEIKNRNQYGETINEIADDIFDNKLSKSLYPKGRTARTLCRKCNTFLGKYDEAYLKFFNADGNPNIVKGFRFKTKIQIIKSIYAKFLSVPETNLEIFDFIDFLKNENETEYRGKWQIYLVQRDYSCDPFPGIHDLGTGKLEFKEGIVYELSDDKFIYNLMNFEKHEQYRMTNIFDILNKEYSIVKGLDEYGGYHGQILMSRLFKSFSKD